MSGQVGRSFPRRSIIRLSFYVSGNDARSGDTHPRNRVTSHGADDTTADVLWEAVGKGGKPRKPGRGQPQGNTRPKNGEREAGELGFEPNTAPLPTAANCERNSIFLGQNSLPAVLLHCSKIGFAGASLPLICH